jgi:Flp pilus assembly protein TadD
MHTARSFRTALLAMTLLSASAAAGPVLAAGVKAPRFTPTGVYSAYLAGIFAVNDGDFATGSSDLLRAIAADPMNQQLQEQAFLACVLAGRPEAARLARQMPDNPIAQLLLADLDARAGRWDAAEHRFHTLPRQGTTEVLRPLLLAWAQQGAKHTDTALNTLRPYVEGSRFKGIYALHAGLIADLAGRNADAARFYRIAQSDFGGSNLRLVQILASWQARQGHMAEAQQSLSALGDGGNGLALVVPALQSTMTQRPVRSASDGIAETYLALAASLQQQQADSFSLLLLRLALDLRPDFTAARLLMADIQATQSHQADALATLGAVPQDDPLAPLVRLRQAQLAEQLGRSDESLRILHALTHNFPMRPEPFELLGDALRSKKQFAEAAAAYDEAIKRVPHAKRADWRLFYERGIAYDRAGQWDKAQADFEQALQLSPDQPYVLNYLAYSWAEQGRNLAQARQMLEKAVAQRPNDGAIIDSLGWTLLKMGDKDGAVQMLERAAELLPEDPEINGHLGDAYAATGRPREAEFQWRRALSLNPDPADVPKLQAKLDKATQEPPQQTGAATPAPTHAQP